jgi:hypothetical protein
VKFLLHFVADNVIYEKFTADNDLISWDLKTGELEKEIRLYDPAQCKLNIVTIDNDINA